MTGKYYQHDLIMTYLDEHGSITAMEAILELGITKLSTRISELERRGVHFEKQWEEGKNRYGAVERHLRYRLAA